MPSAKNPLPPIDPWLWARTWCETQAAGLSPQGIGLAQRDARLARMLQHAACHSPLYRDRCTASAGQPPGLADFEPVDKAELMHRFDDWAADRRITRAGVEAFLEDEHRLADAYLGEYLVWTSSGTQGEPGIFVQDAPSLAAYDALDLLRFRGQSSVTTWGAAPQRFAFVAATGGHFAGVASIERLRRCTASAMGPWLAPAIRTFSVQTPLHELQGELQAFAPTVLITYPSCADALAEAQAGGGVRLASLQEVWLGGEQLSGPQRQRIQSAFGGVLRNNYGASEFYSMAWECPAGQLHLNHDWVLLEPVDEKLRPVPVGEASHSVLLTHLANRAQPLIRYRLCDSLRFIAAPCPCGSGFPAIEVQGRADHTLTLRDGRGRAVPLLPLALMTVLEEGAGVTRFQLLQTGPSALELRLEPQVAQRAAAFARMRSALEGFLAAQGLGNVRVAAASSQAPLHHACSGKVSRVLQAPARRGRAAAGGKQAKA
jgi:phenylacetate-CoA ligase